MRLLLVLVLSIGLQGAFAQVSTPSPNETPAGRSSDVGKTPEHSATEHASEAAGGAAKQGAEHAAAAVKHGEGQAEHAMPNEIWWKLANFVILVGGLGYLIGKNAGPFFRTRTASIQRGITEASQMKAEAEARAGEIETRVSRLAADIDALKQSSQKEMAAEHARLQAETERQLAKLQAQGEAEIASAAKHASAELKAYSADLALELAETQIRSRMNSGLQDSLATAFVHDLGRQPGGDGAVQ